MPDFERRRQRLRRRLRRARVPGLLVTDFTNVTYLTGFTGDDSYLLITDHETLLLSDSRFTQQLSEECPEVKATIRTSGVSMADSVRRVVRAAKLSRLGIEAGSMTVGLYQQLSEELEGVAFVPTTQEVEELRAIKDRDEVRSIRVAVELAQRAFGVIRAALRPEQTEQDLAAALEQQIRNFGGSGCSFTPIVGVGPRAALPHAVLSDRQIGESDFVLIDWGARQSLYVSDLTRMLVTAKIPPKLESVYHVVLQAQQAGIDAIKPGVTMEDVDAAARSVIEQAGYGKRFGHGLGHGIGLQVHEMPRLAAGQKKPLRAGMVVTVEPGIYLPGWGGVRIEDDVLVTRSGCEVLSTLSREFADCVVTL